MSELVVTLYDSKGTRKTFHVYAPTLKDLAYEFAKLLARHGDVAYIINHVEK